MTFPRAFIFDLNGTMINDMSYHQKAWYKIVHDELGSSITFEDVKTQLYGKNEDLLWRVFPGRDFSKEALEKISKRKEIYYQQDYKPHLKFLPGLSEFLQLAKKSDIKMAIGSAAVRGNINFVLDNLGSKHFFESIVSADDVIESKPNPETFLKAALQLGIPAEDCVVFEDAPKGVESAQNAGMKCVVLTTMHEADEFSRHDNILMFVRDYTDEKLGALFEKH